MGKPSYLRAAIEDWVNDRISLERLCELWGVNFHAAYRALSFGDQPVGGRIKHPETIERILRGVK